MDLSIIIPCYNSDRFIERTLNMLISQGLNDCEVIVVDDGSKDNTLSIAQSIAKNNENITVIHQENKGVSVARNVGIENARGKYIYFFDSDDALTDGTIEFFKETIKNNPNHSMYGFGYKTVYNGKLLKDYCFPKFDAQIIDSLLLKQIFLSKKICFHICSCIYEREFLVKNNLFFTLGLAIGEDIEFLLKSFDLTKDMYYSSRCCFVYQIRNDSAMQGYKTYSKKQYNSFEVNKKLISKEDYQIPELKKYSNFFLENSLLSNIVYYLKSSVNDVDITNLLCKDCEIFKRPISNGYWKNAIAIRIAKLLPMKFIIKMMKRK